MLLTGQVTYKASFSNVSVENRCSRVYTKPARSALSGVDATPAHTNEATKHTLKIVLANQAALRYAEMPLLTTGTMSGAPSLIASASWSVSASCEARSAEMRAW